MRNTLDSHSTTTWSDFYATYLNNVKLPYETLYFRKTVAGDGPWEELKDDMTMGEISVMLELSIAGECEGMMDERLHTVSYSSWAPWVRPPLSIIVVCPLYI
eukprot:GHVU01052995.1.p1 GENE.GHVU01052995.1~~GHVU01052995.1.p1  ORF type:complete len:102 (+),score=8.98 GHVU01052995.1:531-836(+)